MSVQKAINNFNSESGSSSSGSTLSVGSGSVTASPLRKSWGPHSKSSITKLSQEELVAKLMEEEAATAALQQRLQEIVNSRMEMEEIRNKIVQMLSDVRDTLSVFEQKAAANNEEAEVKGRSATVCIVPDDKEMTEEDKKKLEEEKARQKAQERILKERKKAEERQKKFREKESSLLTKSQSLNSNEQSEDKVDEKKENLTIEVKSAFRRVEGITIDQLRQDAEKALKEDSNHKVSNDSPSTSQHKQLDKSWRLSLNFKKKDKDKDKGKDISKDLAKVLKAKAELVAQEKQKLKAQQGGQ